MGSRPPGRARSLVGCAWLPVDSSPCKCRPTPTTRAHRIANQVAATEPFLSAFNCLPPPDPVAQNVLAPEQYSILLDELGAVDQHVRLQVYAHHLDSTASVVEWTRGTTLTRFTKLLEPDLAGHFIDTFRGRILSELGDSSPYFYPFKRILIWATKG